MTAVPTTLPARGSGAIWPAAIIGLLGINAAIVGVTIFYATTDPSVAVEPNYYEKAVKWDDAAAQHASNARLGWNVQVGVTMEASGSASGRARLLVRVVDAQGAPVDGAQLSAVAFHNARSGNRQNILLEPVENGAYAGFMTMDRAGSWHWLITARKGADTFTREFDQDVLDVQPRAATAPAAAPRVTPTGETR